MMMKSFPLFLVLFTASAVDGFTVIPSQQAISSTSSALGMGKGLNKARNKQAELAKRMKLAKNQREGSAPADEKKELTDEEIKERNDRLRFDAMLKSSAVTVGSEYESGGYLSQSQEEEEIKAARSGQDRLFEGDPAASQPFEELVSMKSGDVIGKNGASRLLPWMRKSRSSDYLIIISEPRIKSPELRSAMKSLAVDLPANMRDRLIVVNADSPAENRRWTKKNNCFDIPIYSDEKREWMRAYTALGQDRLSMSMFVVADERIQRLAREVDGLQIQMVVTNAIKSLD